MVAVGLRRFAGVRDQSPAHQPAQVRVSQPQVAQAPQLDGEVPNVLLGLLGVVLGAQQFLEPLLTSRCNFSGDPLIR
jgi:hypothetical protein